MLQVKNYKKIKKLRRKAICLTVLWTYSHLKQIKVKKTSVRKTYLNFLKLLTCLLTLLMHLADNTEDQEDLLCRFKNCGCHKNVKSNVSLKKQAITFYSCWWIKFHTHLFIDQTKERSRSCNTKWNVNSGRIFFLNLKLRGSTLRVRS